MDKSVPFCTHMAMVGMGQAPEVKQHPFCMQMLRALASGFASYPQQGNYHSSSQQHLYYPLYFLYTLSFLNLRQKYRSPPSVCRLLNIHFSPWQHLYFCFDSSTSTKNFLVVFSSSLARLCQLSLYISPLALFPSDYQACNFSLLPFAFLTFSHQNYPLATTALQLAYSD